MGSRFLKYPLNPTNQYNLRYIDMKTFLKVTAAFLFACVLLIGGCAVVIGGAASAVDEQEKKQDASAPVGTVGTPLENAGTTYTVSNVENTSTIGSSYSKETTSGTFVVIDLELTNNKDETKTFMSSSAKLRTTDGKDYDTSDKGMFANDTILILEEIHPDLTTKGKLVFELPASKAAGSQLVIEDLWGDGSVKFDLGL